MKKVISIILLFVGVTALNAQDKWSLSQCIEHAMSHNIQIKQKELNTQYQENTLQQSKYNRLPDLGAGVSQNFSFGRSLNTNNNYVNTTSANTGLSLNSDVVLWNGGRLNNSIKKQNFEVLCSMEDMEKVKDDITMNIAQAFLKVLYSQELVNVAEKQVEQTKKQIERSKQLVEAGSLSEGALLEIEAQEARENLAWVNAKNDYKLALLDLAQLLELEDYKTFAVETPTLPEIQAGIDLLSAQDVYANAIENRPEIRSANYKLESNNADLKIIKAGRIPSLSAYAEYYNQYYTASNVSGESSFSQQLQDNSRSSVGLSLSIPIFSRNENKTNIKNAQLQIESQQLEVESAKKQLRKEIEQAYINAYAAFESYNANKTAVESMEESFRYMETKFDLGKANSVEYNEAKTNLYEAQSDLLQSKYKFIFRSKILNFYNGTPIEL